MIRFFYKLKRAVFAPLFFSLLIIKTAPIYADLSIPKECMVKNIPPGYCAFVSIEIVGRTHKIDKLYGLVESRTKDPDIIRDGKTIEKNLGDNFAIRDKLNTLNVKFSMQDSGIYSKDLLKKSDNNGCIIAVINGAIDNCPGCHAIILIHYDDKVVRFVDCNTPDKVWEASHAWLMKYWTGLAIVIDK